MRLRRRTRRRSEGLLLAEGPREVSRAIKAGLAIQDVFICPPLLEAIIQLPQGIAVYEVEPDLFVKMTYRDDPEGILAVVEEPQWSLDRLPPTTDQSQEDDACCLRQTLSATARGWGWGVGGTGGPGIGPPCCKNTTK